MGPLSQAQKEAWSIYIYPNGGVFPCGDPWNVPPGKKEDIEIPENCPLCEEPTSNTYLVDKVIRQIARNFEKITLEQLRTLLSSSQGNLLTRAVILSPCKDPANEEEAQIGHPCSKCRKTVEAITLNKNLRDFAIQVENYSRTILLPDYKEELPAYLSEEEVKEEHPPYLDDAFYAVPPPILNAASFVDDATIPPPAFAFEEGEVEEKALVVDQVEEKKEIFLSDIPFPGKEAVFQEFHKQQIPPKELVTLISNEPNSLLAGIMIVHCKEEFTDEINNKPKYLFFKTENLPLIRKYFYDLGFPKEDFKLTLKIFKYSEQICSGITRTSHSCLDLTFHENKRFYSIICENNTIPNLYL